MASTAFNLIYFAIHERCDADQRELVIFHDGPKPCARCGGNHVELYEFYCHFN